MSTSTEGLSLAPNAGRQVGRQHVTDVSLWILGLLSVAILAWMSWLHASDLVQDAADLVPWIGVMAVANLLPVSGLYSTSVAPDLPIAIAAALILSPVETGLVAFFGAFDPKELRRQIPIRKALFNRGQVAIADLLGSVVGHAILRKPSSSPLTLPIALAVLGTIVILNLAFVGPFVSLERQVPLRNVIRRLHPGAPIDLALTFLAWGVLGAMLAALFVEIHAWALVAFLAPILLGRQVLSRSQMFLDAVHAYQSREKVLTEISHRIHEERSDERRMIAADLHDEVLQPLFKVSLMAHVIKADLVSGRLLEMDEDLPELLSAAEVASGTLRALIGDLRRSTLGRGGLDRALSSLVRALQTQGSPRVRSQIEPVQTNPDTELVIYQIAKEGLANALTHSRATEVIVSLEQSDDTIVLSITDNGIGFSPAQPKEGHFGLHIMRERAASVGSTLYLDSFLGGGCSVRLLVPLGLAKPEESV